MPKGFGWEKRRFDLTNIGKPSQYFLPEIEFLAFSSSMPDFKPKSSILARK
jgi:hypothetical protein